MYGEPFLMGGQIQKIYKRFSSSCGGGHRRLGGRCVCARAGSIELAPSRPF